MLTRNDMLQWLRRKPFAPFQVHTSGGRVFDVPHPELVALGETTMVIYTVGSNRWTEVSLFQIDTVEKQEEAAASAD